MSELIEKWTLRENISYLHSYILETNIEKLDVGSNSTKIALETISNKTPKNSLRENDKSVQCIICSSSVMSVGNDVHESDYRKRESIIT